MPVTQLCVGGERHIAAKHEEEMSPLDIRRWRNHRDPQADDAGPHRTSLAHARDVNSSPNTMSSSRNSAQPTTRERPLPKKWTNAKAGCGKTKRNPNRRRSGTRRTATSSKPKRTKPSWPTCEPREGPFELIPPTTGGGKGQAFYEEASSLVRRREFDLLFLDPPYNERCYASYYHLPETLAKHIEPEVSGKAGVPLNREFKKSPFTVRSLAADAFAYGKQWLSDCQIGNHQTAKQ